MNDFDYMLNETIGVTMDNKDVADTLDVSTLTKEIGQLAVQAQSLQDKTDPIYRKLYDFFRVNAALLHKKMFDPERDEDNEEDSLNSGVLYAVIQRSEKQFYKFKAQNSIYDLNNACKTLLKLLKR